MISDDIYVVNSVSVIVLYKSLFHVEKNKLNKLTRNFSRLCS